MFSKHLLRHTPKGSRACERLLHACQYELLVHADMPLAYAFWNFCGLRTILWLPASANASFRPGCLPSVFNVFRKSYTSFVMCNVRYTVLSSTPSLTARLYPFLVHKFPWTLLVKFFSSRGFRNFSMSDFPWSSEEALAAFSSHFSSFEFVCVIKKHRSVDNVALKKTDRTNFFRRLSHPTQLYRSA